MPHQLYVIEFPNGKKYFGITGRRLCDRWKSHLSVSKRRDTPLCCALRKYKNAATIRSLVIGCRDYIYDLEIRTIEVFKTRDRKYGYNVGFGGEISPMLGISHTSKSRAKIGEASRKRPRLAESNAKTSATLTGHSVPEETRIKISIATKEAMKNPTIRKKISTALSGRSLSPEHIASLIGRTLSLEHRTKISAGNKGKTRSAEICAKMSTLKWWHKEDKTTRSAICPGNDWLIGRGSRFSISRKDKRPSPETCAKMSIAAKKRMTAEVRAKISKKLTGRKTKRKYQNDGK